MRGPVDETALTALSSILIIVGNMSYIPQMREMIRTKSSRNISKLGYWMSAAIACGWIYYTYAMEQSQQLLSNVVWLLFTLATLFLLYYYDGDTGNTTTGKIQ
jgi:uncharacterized protein with PQ loop repeat